MIFVTIAFFISSFVVGIAKIVAGDTWSGVAFLLAAIFGFWAGSAIKIAIFAPASRPRDVGFLLAASFTAFALLVTWLSDVHFEAYGHNLHGAAWVVAGLIAGILGTRRRRYPAAG